MNAIAEEILSTKQVQDAEGRKHPLHSDTSQEQCEFIQRMIREVNGARGVEVGLAYGISTLFIGEAISSEPNRRLVSIDPFQREHWNNIGRHNVERAGYDTFVEFHEDFSHSILPRLLAEGRKYDFAYVDTSKQFEVILVDAYYISRLLRVGGVMIFDDCLFPGISKAMRLISQWPHFKLHAKFGAGATSLKRRAASAFVKVAPTQLFNPELELSNDELGIHAHCLAFRKLAEDTRSYDWHQRF